MVSAEKEHFEEYKKLIYKLVKQRYLKQKSSRPDVTFEDLLSEAYYIYSWCLQNYKENRNAKFVTYLYIQLKGRLIDYYKVTSKKFDLYEDYVPDDCKTDYESIISSRDYNINNEQLYMEAKQNLSYEGNEVLKYILSREWEHEQNHCHPSKAQIRKKFKYNDDVVNSILLELKMFWKKNQRDFGYMVV